MERSEMKRQNGGKMFDYLRVDDFIKDMVAARALTTAFELRLIDTLIPSSHDGMKLLLKLLADSGVLENQR
jgi:hypothetical protein